MKIKLFILTALLALSCNSNLEKTEPVLEEKEEVVDGSEQEEMEGSQTDINLEEAATLAERTQLLDSMYNAVIIEYATLTTFVKNFKKSQALWKEYMEAQVLARFPEDDEIREGSAFNMCYGFYKKGLVNERIKAVNDWLVGFPQGEMCGGSVKVQ